MWYRKNEEHHVHRDGSRKKKLNLQYYYISEVSNVVKYKNVANVANLMSQILQLFLALRKSFLVSLSNWSFIQSELRNRLTLEKSSKLISIDMSVLLLKSIKDVLLVPLIKLTWVLKIKIFSSCLKNAKVIPVHKKSAISLIRIITIPYA